MEFWVINVHDLFDYVLNDHELSSLIPCSKTIELDQSIATDNKVWKPLCKKQAGKQTYSWIPPSMAVHEPL